MKTIADYTRHPNHALTARDFRNALQSQDACNMIGLLKSFADVSDRIWQEAREVKGGGSEWYASHPIARMYVTQFAHLGGLYLQWPEDGHGMTYHEATVFCQERATELEAAAKEAA